MTERALVEALLPGYVIDGEIGRGAWGVVYAGRHRHLGRDVAIKLLPRVFGADPAAKQRFVTEARLLATLDHPHIVPVYDYAEDAGLCLLVLERLAGGTLTARAGAPGFDTRAACAAAVAVCLGLEHAHRRGVLHRDVKPDNILFAASGRPKVVDFGIAKVVSDARRADTRVGDVLGTPAYMSPEQARGGALGPGTDVYAVAVVLYELLAQRLPFPDDGDAMALLWRHVYEEPIDLHGAAPGVPDAVADVVMAALSKRPEDRPASAEALGSALVAAAVPAWGPDWIETSGMPVELSNEVRAAGGRATPSVSGLRHRSLPPPAPASTARVPSAAPQVPASRSIPTVVVTPASMPGTGLPAPTPTADRPIDPGALRVLRLAESGQARLNAAEIAEVRTLLTPATVERRLGMPDGTDVGSLRDVAVRASERWRTRREHPLAGADLCEVCDSVVRCYEALHQTIGR